MAKVKTRKKKEIPPHVREAASEAAKGNQWWKLRSKHGRDKLFKTPELLMQAAEEYFQSIEDNPDTLVKPMVVSSGNGMGSDVEKVEVDVRKPYTMHGLCRYLNCTTSYFRAFKSTINAKREITDEDNDFLTVIAQIEEIIYDQKFSGAANGFFNTNIIARDLGLVDRQDRTSGDVPIAAPVVNVYKNGAPPLSSEETKH